MKLPDALKILKEEVGPEWEDLPGEVKDDMLGTLRFAENTLKRDLRGEDTKEAWLHVKAQAIAWVSGAKAGIEKAWWRALKRYAEAIGEALVEGVKIAAKGALPL